MSKDGGPAFPVVEIRDCDGNGIGEGSDGISLRDYFAAQALAGVMANHRLNHGQVSWQEDTAWAAYSIANAMLAEREKENGK